MFSFRKLVVQTIFVLLVIGVSLFLFAPNFLSQRLVVGFKQKIRTVEGEQRVVTAEEVEDFLADRENGLKLFFPDSPCIPEEGDNLPASHRCQLTERFITTARVNEIVQTFPNLIDERQTTVLPHPIELFVGRLIGAGEKNLKVKLGLDLQGGMRAIFQADFASFIERLQEKQTPLLESLKKQLEKAQKEEEKNDLRNQITTIERDLTVDDARRLQLLKDSKDIIDKRLAAQNLTEPEVRIQEESYSIAVDMPGVANSSDVLARIKDTVTVEYRIVNDEATLEVNGTAENRADLENIKQFYRNKDADPLQIKEILENVTERSQLSAQKGRLFLYWRRARANYNSPLLPREYRVLGPPILDGSEMQSAWSGVGGTSAWHQISFRLTDTGAKNFGDITEKNRNKRLAILWGDRVVSDPEIREPIYGGTGVISGQFTEQEAREITNVIREGALPIPLKVISVSFVGPGLGRESIVAGVTSILIGYLVVLFFMLSYYRLSGLIAIMALFLNLLIMAAVMSLLEFTFTLPGFAGIVLTVGMAVDASVIIFEKIKEDLHAGKSPPVAIENGFDASLWTILDANITTLIAAIILWLPRDGPIMGFAIVLFFGLLISMFTALFVARLVFAWAVYLFQVRRLSIGYGLKEL